ncbi:MAG: galactokinase [Solobacterium sp.]|nr:galactokinase [Solobacterium sp.]
MMISVNTIKTKITDDESRKKLAWLYCCDDHAALDHARRYLHVLNGLEESFGPHECASLFSAPGRTEIGGNHTDHQHGCVVAASVNMDMIAAAGPNSCGRIRLHSEGYEPCAVSLDDLAKKPEEEGTSVSILRGICKAFEERGAALSGLDLYVTSNVPGGSGISSSAAFETLLGTVFNELFMGEKKVSCTEIAIIGQWAENVYFGKPCGLMDQMASSFGGVIGVDFKDPAAPAVKKIEFDLKQAGFALCIINSGADHADLTDEYAAVPSECRAVARACGCEYLRDVPEEVFYAELRQIRSTCSDRAVLRAIHFFDENVRAQQEISAIENHDYREFLRLAEESGHSSWEYLQNITPTGEIRHQAVAVTIALAKKALRGKGAVRVHGGGFAGTVQAFVPEEMTDEFTARMETTLGKGKCFIMSIRPAGGIRIL